MSRKPQYRLRHLAQDFIAGIALFASIYIGLLFAPVLM